MSASFLGKVSVGASISGKKVLEKLITEGIGSTALVMLVEAVPPIAIAAAMVYMGYAWAHSGSESQRDASCWAAFDRATLIVTSDSKAP